MQPIGLHCCEVMYFGCFSFRGDIGFLNCDDICMCVVNKPFELLEFVFNSAYVDLKYNEISLTFTAGSVCLCGVCSHAVVLGLGPGSGMMGWCYVCVSCVDGRSRYLYIVLGRYLRILGAPSVHSCCTLSISASY